MYQQLQIDSDDWDIFPEGRFPTNRKKATVSTGYADLDAILPNGGLPNNDLVEMISPQWSTKELQLVLPLMKEVIDQDKWVLWIAPPHIPCAPTLVSAGIDISRVITIHPESSCGKALHSIDQALKNDECGMVIAWLDWLPNSVVRRIQSAARDGNKLGILFRQFENRNSPAALRLQLSPNFDGVNVITLPTSRTQGDSRRDCVYLSFPQGFHQTISGEMQSEK